MKKRLVIGSIAGCLVLFFLTRCKPAAETNMELIGKAESIIWQMPDSALAILNSVDTTLLDAAQHAGYILLQVQAKDKAAQDIAADTAIFCARDYFVAAKDNQKAALAGYYAAKVYEAYGNDSLSIAAYLEALKYAGKTNDHVLKGKIQNNIGVINYNKDLYLEAISWFKQALRSFRQAGNEYKREGRVCIHLGEAYLLNSNNDSAMYYYQTAMNVAQNHGDTALLASTFMDMGMAYYELDHYNDARKYSLRAMMLTPQTDHATLGKIYMSLATIYFGMDKTDSVSYYLNMAEPLLKASDDLEPLISLSFLIYQYEKENGNCVQALTYHEQYGRYREMAGIQKNSRIILELQRKYDVERMQNENNRQIARRHRIITFLSLAILLAGCIIYYVNRSRLRFKELHEKAQQDAGTLRAMLGSDHTTRNNLREALVQYMKVAPDIAALHKLMDQGKDPVSFAKKIKELKAKITQQSFMTAIEAISPGLPGKIKALSSKLDDKDVCICCCSILDYDNDAISMIINVKKNTVEQWKTNIRSELGIETRGDIGKFLKQRLELPTDK